MFFFFFFTDLHIEGAVSAQMHCTNVVVCTFEGELFAEMWLFAHLWLCARFMAPQHLTLCQLSQIQAITREVGSTWEVLVIASPVDIIPGPGRSS